MNAERNRGRLSAVVFALAVKELRESGAAIIVGACIFIGLPVLWTIVYRLVDPAGEIVAGMAVQTFTLCGWLFAPVLAAQAVCRDWGRPVGDFLLARPVSARLAMLVKGVVTFAIIVGLIAAVMLLEAALRSVDNPSVITARLSGAAIAASCVAFWIAFGAAAITRDTFRSVLLAVFVLVLVTLAPLLSGRFSWLSIESRMGLMPDGHMWALVPLAWAAVTGISSLGLLAALLGAAAPGAMKVTTRSIAWAMALSMLVLFPLALGEVGNDVSQVTTHWLPSRLGQWHGRIAVGRRRMAIVGSGPLILFEVSERGEVVEAPVRPREDGRLYARMFFDVPAALVPLFDESDQFYLIESGRYADRSESQRATLRSFDWYNRHKETSAKLALPKKLSSSLFAFARDAVIEDSQLVVWYSAKMKVKPHTANETTFGMLAVYDLDGENKPTLTSASELGPSAPWQQLEYDHRLSRGADGRVYVVAENWALPVSAFPRDAGFDHFGYYGEERFVPAYGQLAINQTYGQFVIQRGFTAASTRSGLRVLYGTDMMKDRGKYYDTTPGKDRYLRQAELVAYTKASPWSWLFRSDRPLLTYAGPGRVWEVHRRRGSAICYDVSDPLRPRRIAHVSTYRIQDAVSGPEFLVLDHGAGFSIVRHPK